jgi:hypothetical protein
VNDTLNSWGSCVADISNDGFTDVFIAHHPDTKNGLFINEGNSNNWLSIKCIGDTSNKSAIGTRVKVKALINGVPVWQMKAISGQTAYYSQNTFQLNFGLGNAVIVDTLIITWSLGLVETYTNLSLNQFYTAIEGQGINPIGITPVSNIVPDKFSLGQNYPNPFNPSTTIKFDLAKSEFTELSVYDETGKLITTIINENLERGSYSVNWNAYGLPSGVYFYRLKADSFSETRKMILLK